MITTRTAKLINILPKGFVSFIAKGLINKYLNKYANIMVDGKEKLSKIQRPTIFVCNHLSNSDGLVLSRALKSVDPTFVAGVKLSADAVTNMGFYVVKTTSIKPDSADKEALKRITKLVKGGESLLIFPEGTRSRSGSLIEAKKGILLIARMTGAPIVPLGIHGSEKLLPINKNGNMSEEKFHYADVHIKIGDQFELPKRSKEQDKKIYEAFATNLIMEKIAELLPEDYRGVYGKGSL